MKESSKYSVGEFSEKTGVSIRTLHYYDEIGLLQPEKSSTSGHRIYKHQEIITLQKIMSLKFLGYSLDKITSLLNEESFTIDLNEALKLHSQQLEKDKEAIEQSLTAIQRVIKLVEAEGEVDSNVLFSLIRSIQTENIQKEWAERHNLTHILEDLSMRTEEEKMKLDQTFIQLAKEVKQLYGKPEDDPKVQEMIKNYLEASFAYLGGDLMQKMAETEMDEMDIQQLEDATPSPFSEDEQIWLNQAMAYYMEHAQME